jgi:hypothetical protein
MDEVYYATANIAIYFMWIVFGGWVVLVITIYQIEHYILVLI